MTASASPSLRHSLRVQGRVLWALLLREMPRPASVESKAVEVVIVSARA